MDNDGLRSRKFLSTVVGTGAIEVVASVAFFLDKMDAPQWLGFNQWLWPLALGIFCSANVAEKLVLKNAATPPQDTAK